MTTTPVTALRAANAKRSYWMLALAAGFLPWLVTSVKLLVVAVDAPFDAIETMISAMLYSLPLSALAWLGLTALTFIRGGWRQGRLATIGLMPLGAFYVITIAAFDR